MITRLIYRPSVVSFCLSRSVCLSLITNASRFLFLNSIALFSQSPITSFRSPGRPCVPYVPFSPPYFVLRSKRQTLRGRSSGFVYIMSPKFLSKSSIFPCFKMQRSDSNHFFFPLFFSNTNRKWNIIKATVLVCLHTNRKQCSFFLLISCFFFVFFSLQCKSFPLFYVTLHCLCDGNKLEQKANIHDDVTLLIKSRSKIFSFLVIIYDFLLEVKV